MGLPSLKKSSDNEVSPRFELFFKLGVFFLIIHRHYLHSYSIVILILYEMWGLKEGKW